MNVKEKTMTSDEAWDLFEAHIKGEKEIPYENLTFDFSGILRSNPRVQDSFTMGRYTVEISDCFHFLVARVVGLSDWFNYGVINTWDSRLNCIPAMVYFRALDGEEYVINVEEECLYKRVD